MLIKQIIDVYDLLDDSRVDGRTVVDYLRTIDPGVNAETYPLTGPRGTTHMLKVRIPGSDGKSSGGSTPTLGILGRLGGLGARPEMIGYVSDGDGALAALAIAVKLLDMKKKGDVLPGDIFISTHICPDAPTKPHDPVPFMGSPVEISQPVKEGYILRASEGLLDIMQRTTGRLPYVFPVNTQDITPYGNDVHHINSIMQPCTYTDAPVVGVAITTETMVPGCATGCSHFADVEETARFVLEAAKSYGRGEFEFYDKAEFERMVELYGSMKRLQTLGATAT